MLKQYLNRLRCVSPRIHCITNYVTANDVANLLLACRAKPIMAEEPEEAAQVTAGCDGLCLNLGTPNEKKISAMLAAGRQAHALGHPVVFDPVGVGASDFRRRSAALLIENISFSAIRGNISEIKTLALGQKRFCGVDADCSDEVTPENIGQISKLFMQLCAQWDTILVSSGAIDLVCDSARCYAVYNGTEQMRFVTGTGCQLSAMLTAFLAANPEDPLQAALCAVCMMGYAGEVAWKNLSPIEGNVAYRGKIIDAVFRMDEDSIEEGAKFELR